MSTWCWVIWQTPHFRRSGIQKWNGITSCVCMTYCTTEATISCKNLVKIGPVVSAENRLTDGNRVVVCVFCRISPDILDRFSQSFYHMKALYVPIMDLCLIFQFVKGRCHGKQIMLPQWRQSDTTFILSTFARWQIGFVSLLLARCTLRWQTGYSLGFAMHF